MVDKVKQIEDNPLYDEEARYKEQKRLRAARKA